MKVFWQETVFSVAIAVVVTVSMTWVGLLVINSLLVLPAAVARNVSRTMFQYHLVSLLGAVLAGIAGLMTSYYVAPPPARPSRSTWRCGSWAPSWPGKSSKQNSRRPPAVFVVSNLKILVLQGAEIRLGGAGRDALEGIVPKGRQWEPADMTPFLSQTTCSSSRGRLRVQ